MKRPIIDRLQDRAWREIGRLLERNTSPALSQARSGTSISSDMPWTAACEGFASGQLDSRGFRRSRAVRDIVETVGPVEGRFYAECVKAWGPQWLDDPAVAAIDSWGDPITWPGVLLGTQRAFSPTTLRYLATAVWLAKSGSLENISRIVEIGVGFGGLAAMNRLVSGKGTMLVDLPQVERAARKMLVENGLTTDAGDGASYVISNYAFTELSSAVQEQYFESHIKGSSHGMIVSNSAIFADRIGGRDDAELLRWFREEGLDAVLDTEHELLGPGDRLNRVTMIRW